MRLNPFAVMREEFDGTGFVFTAENNQVMTLNAAGVAVWKALARGASETEIVQALLDRFSAVTAEQAEADVHRFLDKLREKSLLAES